MTKRSIQLLSVPLLCVLLLSGCGFIGRFGLDKQVAKVEEAKARAEQTQAERYAVEQWTQAQNKFQQANNLIDQKDYKQAKEMLTQAEQAYVQAEQMAPQRRMQFEQQIGVLQENLRQIGETLQQAQATGAGQVAPQELATAQAALGAAEAAVAAATGAPTLELNALIQMATGTGPVEIARQMTQALLNATLATQVAAASQEMQVMWANLTESGAETTNPDEVAALSEMRNQLQSLLASQAYVDFLQAYSPFRERTLALVRGAFEGRLNTALTDAEASLSRARALGGEEFGGEDYQSAAAALEAARTALAAEDYREALSQAETAQQRAKAAIEKMQADADRLLADARQLLKAAQDVEADQFQAEEFNAGRRSLSAAEAAQQAGNTDALLSEARQAVASLTRAIEATRQGRATALLERHQRRLAALQEQGAGEIAPQALTEAEDLYGQITGMNPQEQFDQVLDTGKRLDTALGRVEDAVRQRVQTDVQSAETEVDRARQFSEGRYAAAAFQRAETALTEAQQAVKANKFNEAVVAAGAAVNLAGIAIDEAIAARAEEKMAAADAEQGEAVAAGAKQYALGLFQQGEASLAEARELVQEGTGEEVLAAATRAEEQFRGARTARLVTARKAKAEAETANAPQLSADLFAAADAQLTEAEAAMDAKDYAEANRIADAAAAQFQLAASKSWEQRVAEIAPRAESEVAFLAGNLAERYTAKPYKSAAGSAADMRAYRSVGMYKKAFDSATASLAASENTRGALSAELDRFVAEQTARLERLVEILRDDQGVTMSQSARQAGLAARQMREAGASIHDQFVAYETLSAALDSDIASVVGHNRKLLNDELAAKVVEWESSGAVPLAEDHFQALHEKLGTIAEGDDTLPAYNEVASLYEQMTAELATMEETIRRSMEQMLADTRGNLESAAYEGAGRTFPSFFASAEDLYRHATDLPKGRNYEEIADAVVSAHERSQLLLDVTRLYNEEQLYRSTVYEQIDQANNLLKKFAYVIEVGPRGWEAAQSSHRANLFAGVQRIVSASEFFLIAQTLEQRINELVPPPTMKDIHKKVIASFEELTLTGELFQKYGDYSYGTETRKRFIRAAFEHYEKREQMMLEIDKQLSEGTRVQEAFQEGEAVIIRKIDYQLRRLGEKTRALEDKLADLIWGTQR